jgi:protein-disulfide isomerase
MSFLRLSVMALAAASLALAAPALAASKPFLGPEVDMGKADAPITVIEYGSASCPHCARFNNNVFPEFKAKYIDTGKVHYVFREFLTQPADFAAAGFLMARCVGRDQYLAVVADIFHDQDKIYQSNDLPGGLRAIGEKYGLSKSAFETCVRDPVAQKALEARQAAAQTAGIDGTPTFLINKERVEGETTLGDLMLVIEPMLAKAAADHH